MSGVVNVGVVNVAQSSQRLLWSDFSFWQVLKKSLCVLRHSKQQPVWKRRQRKNKQIQRIKTFMLVHCLEFYQTRRSFPSWFLISVGSLIQQTFPGCKKCLIIEDVDGNAYGNEFWCCYLNVS